MGGNAWESIGEVHEVAVPERVSRLRLGRRVRRVSRVIGQSIRCVVGHSDAIERDIKVG